MTDDNMTMVLRARPNPEVTADLFEPVPAPMPTVGDGQFRIRVVWLGLEPAMRVWIA